MKKKSLIVLAMFISYLGFGQDLIVNGDFEDGNPACATELPPQWQKGCSLPSGGFFPGSPDHVDFNVCSSGLVCPDPVEDLCNRQPQWGVLPDEIGHSKYAHFVKHHIVNEASIHNFDERIGQWLNPPSFSEGCYNLSFNVAKSILPIQVNQYTPYHVIEVTLVNTANCLTVPALVLFETPVITNTTSWINYSTSVQVDAVQAATYNRIEFRIKDFPASTPTYETGVFIDDVKFVKTNVPQADFDLSYIAPCAGNAIIADGSPSTNSDEYHWEIVEVNEFNNPIGITYTQPNQTGAPGATVMQSVFGPMGFTFESGGCYKISLSINNSCGPADTWTETICLDSTDIDLIVSPNPACVDEPVFMEIEGPFGVLVSPYEWYESGNLVNSGPTWNVSSGFSSSTTIQILGTTTHGCPISEQFTINIEPDPDPTFTFNDPDGNYCFGEPVILTVNSIVGSVSNEWWIEEDTGVLPAFDPLAGAVLLGSGSSLDIINAGFSLQGDKCYWVKHVVNSANCGLQEEIKRFCYHNNPVLNLQATYVLCEGEDFQLSLGFVKGHTFSWTIVENITGSSVTQSTPFVNYTPETGSNGFSFTVTVTNSLTGCSTTKFSQIEIILPPSPPVASGPLCGPGSTATFTTNGHSGFTYTWFDQTLKPPLGTGTSITLGAGSYELVAVYDDGNTKCTYSFLFTAVEHSLPVLTAQNLLIGTCDPLHIAATATGNGPFLFDLSGDHTVGQQSSGDFTFFPPVVSNDPNLIFNFLVTVTDINGCIDTEPVGAFNPPYWGAPRIQGTNSNLISSGTPGPGAVIWKVTDQLYTVAGAPSFQPYYNNILSYELTITEQEVYALNGHSIPFYEYSDVVAPGDPDGFVGLEITWDETSNTGITPIPSNLFSGVYQYQLNLKNCSVDYTSCELGELCNFINTEFKSATCELLQTQAEVDAFGAISFGVVDCIFILDNGNDPILDLSSLNNITSVTGGLSVYGCGSLSSLSGLDGITSVGGLSIINNSGLVSLNGLENLAQVGGDFTMQFNNVLTEPCAISNLLNTNGAIGGAVTISNNVPGKSNNKNVIIHRCSKKKKSRLIPPQCGGSIPIPQEKVYAEVIQGANKYKFLVTDPVTSLSAEKEKTANSFQPSSDFSGMITGKTYDVEVAVKKGNSWGTYGPKCQLSIQSVGSGNRIVVVGDSQWNFINEISISPNPNNGQFTINVKGFDGEGEIKVFNMVGQQVYYYSGTFTQHEIDLTQEKNGLYIVKYSNSNSQFVERIVKQ